MKNRLLQAFPVLFAALTTAAFCLLFRPRPGTPGQTSALMVFLTALGWSALIVFGDGRQPALKRAYAAAALLAALLLAAGATPFARDPLAHPLMAALQALGMLGIVLYLRILERKRAPADEP